MRANYGPTLPSFEDSRGVLARSVYGEGDTSVADKELRAVTKKLISTHLTAITVTAITVKEARIEC